MKNEKYDFVAYARKYREKMKERGLCGSCGKKLVDNRCQKCTEVKRKGRKKLREYRKSNGLCYRCGKTVMEGSFTCEACRIKNRKEVSSRKEKTKKSGVCVICKVEKPRDGMVTCSVCGKKSRDKNKELDMLRKEKVMNHYGNKCVCCGEDNSFFLCIDHINNNGSEHRKEIWGNQKRNGKQGGKAFYYWIIQNDFPDDLQILCWNCNMGKHFNGGVCPHQTEGTKP